MARTRTTATTPTTITVNAVNQFKAILEQTGLPFAVDSWVNKAPAEYGVLNYEGQEAADWADGRMIDQAFRVRVRIFVNGQGDEWVETIQTKLDAADVGYNAPAHEYLEDIKKTCWTWNTNFFGPLEYQQQAEA